LTKTKECELPVLEEKARLKGLHETITFAVAEPVRMLGALFGADVVLATPLDVMLKIVIVVPEGALA
jgi:hypothetical protein